MAHIGKKPTRVNGPLFDSNNQVGTASSILVSKGGTDGVVWTEQFAAGIQGLQGLQ